MEMKDYRLPTAFLLLSAFGAPMPVGAILVKP